MSVIDFATKRLYEEADIPHDSAARYWAAYLDGARAQQREDEEAIKKSEKELRRYRELGSVEELDEALYNASF